MVLRSLLSAHRDHVRTALSSGCTRRVERATHFRGTPTEKKHKIPRHNTSCLCFVRVLCFSVSFYYYICGVFVVGVVLVGYSGGWNAFGVLLVLAGVLY